MKLEELREIRACLPAGRSLFYYERDWFKVMLLEYLLEAGWTAPEIRRSEFARLLERPDIRDLISKRGKLLLDSTDMLNLYQKKPVAWRLSLGSWGNKRNNRYHQITRRGFNLVLQINFPEQHNRCYRYYINGKNRDYFNYSGHPASKQELTMAWVRLDVDMEQGEVLIEEIQSDWVRQVAHYSHNLSWLHGRLVRDAAPNSRYSIRDCKQTCKDFSNYADKILPKYTKHWQETALAAAMFFSVHELGIREIFMHDFETGNRLKHISSSYGLPPRSIYTRLPRKFCFQRSLRVPALAETPIAALQKGKRHSHKITEPRFWYLSFLETEQV
ncbi:MAG: hypothetical protein ACR2O3_03225 [Rhizobiaceae bacterium]